MKLKKKLKSVYALFIISYLIIIMVFSGVLFVVNRLYEDAIQSTLTDFNEYVFQKVSDSVNDVFSNINALYSSFISNKTTDEFFSNINGNYMKKESTYDIIQELKFYRKFSLNIDSLFVYLKETDSVLSYQGVIEGEYFYKMYFDTSKMSYDEWKNSYIMQSENKYVDMAYKDNGKIYDANAYVFPIPNYKSKGTGVIISKKKYLVSNINDMEWGSFCDVFVFDGKKELIASVIQGLDEKDTDLLYDSLVSDINETHSTEIVVDNDKWYVVTRVQRDYLEKRMDMVEKLFFIIVLLGVIVLAFVLKALYKHNYQPMKKIFGLLNTSTQQESYSEIYTKVGNFVEQSRNLVTDNKKTKEKLKKVALSKYIRGDISKSELSYEKVEINGKYFAVLLFSINDIDELFGEVKELQSHERYYYLSFILDNVFQELFGEFKMDFYLTDVENYIVGLVSMSELETVGEIKNVAQNGVDFVNKNFNISLSYSLSSVVDGMDAVPKAYDETLQLQLYRQFSKIDDSLSLEDVSFSKKGKYLFSFYREQNLIRYIKMADFKAASEMVVQIFEELRQSDAKSLRNWQYLVADILNTIVKIKDELSDEIFRTESETELYDELVSSKDIDSVKEKLLLHLKDVCDSISAGFNEKKDNKRVFHNVLKIKKYVEDNFTDVNMNVNQISRHFDLTPQYVAKIFKENEAISLLDYINRRRIEYAQELNKNGGYTAKELSKMAGFNNDRTYYRVLKKYTDSN